MCLEEENRPKRPTGCLVIPKDSKRLLRAHKGKYVTGIRTTLRVARDPAPSRWSSVQKDIARMGLHIQEVIDQRDRI